MLEASAPIPTRKATATRVTDRDEHVVIPAATLQDPRLSLTALGVLAGILAMPDDYELDVDALAANSPDDLDTVVAAVNELIAAGYIEYEEWVDAGGQRQARTVIYDTPPGPGRDAPTAGTGTGA